MSADIGQTWDELDAAGKQALQEEGVNIHTLPEQETEKLLELGDELTSDYVEMVDHMDLPGSELLALLDTITKEVGPVGPGCQ